MSIPDGELPSLFDSVSDMGAYKATLVDLLSKHLHKKWKPKEQRHYEGIRNRFDTVGSFHIVEIGTVLVESKYAHSFLDGKYNLEQLMSSAVVLADRAVDWSKVIVENPKGEKVESGPDYVVLSELLVAGGKLGDDGYVTKLELPEFVKDEEYYLRRGELIDIQRRLKEEDKSVYKALSHHGLGTLANIVGTRVGEIGRRHIEAWFDSLEGQEIGLHKNKLKSITIGTTEPIFPEEMKGKVLLALDTLGQWRLRMLRVLDPIVFVVSKKLINNRVRETFVGFEPATHPERIEEPKKVYKINKNHFNILKKDFQIEVAKIEHNGSLLSVKLGREFREILLHTLNEVLGTDQELPV